MEMEREVRECRILRRGCFWQNHAASLHYQIADPTNGATIFLDWLSRPDTYLYRTSRPVGAEVRLIVCGWQLTNQL